MDIDSYIRKIPDFPKSGILFYDISTLLNHPEARAYSIARMKEAAEALKPDVIVGIESRGFIFGLPLAHEMSLPFVMIRKQGKLPGSTVSYAYDLEYGSDTVEISDGMIEPGARVLVVDDLMATGGTAVSSVELLRKIGAEPVGVAVLIELSSLRGRDRFDVPVKTVLTYES